MRPLLVKEKRNMRENNGDENTEHNSAEPPEK